MKLLNTRYAVVIASTITSFVAAAGLLGAGVATADAMGDLEPLLISDCSFTQIDAALHQVAPETAAQLDSAPAQKAALQSAYDQPVEQRRAAFQTLIEQQQKMGVTATANPEMAPKMTQVVETCRQY
ncbi:hemophore-related protein [Nocardia sp. NPDC048505]|uniref:hemophore-related protein n=1 Tax=Nocardia sp. NPDC048505 TaxID=3155756 RepID=UPI003401B3A3